MASTCILSPLKLQPKELLKSLGPSVVAKVVDSRYQYDNDTISPMPTLVLVTRCNRHRRIIIGFDRSPSVPGLTSERFDLIMAMPRKHFAAYWDQGYCYQLVYGIIQLMVSFGFSYHSVDDIFQSML